MKISIFFFSLFVTLNIFSQKVQLYRQVSYEVTEKIIGAYPITTFEAVGSKHYRFSFDNQNRIESIAICKPNEDYSDEGAMQDYFIAYYYVGDTVYQIALNDFYLSNLEETEIVKIIKTGNVGGMRFIYKNGKLVQSHNMSDFSRLTYYLQVTSEGGNRMILDEYRETNENDIIEEEETAQLEDIEEESENEEERYQYGQDDIDELENVENIFVGYDYVYGANPLTYDLYFRNIHGKRIINERINHVRVTFNPSKLITTYSYYGENNERMSLANTVYEINLQKNKEGMIIYTKMTEKNGDLSNVVESLTVNEYDKNGYIRLVQYVDKNLKLVPRTIEIEKENEVSGEVTTLVQDDYSQMIYRNDNNGNVLVATSFDANGNKKSYSNLWCSVVKTYDKYNRITSTRYYDENSKMVENDENAGEILKYSDAGDLLEQTYLGTDNKPKANAQGICIREYSYNETSRTGESYFDADYKPIADASGAHRYEMIIDETDPEAYTYSKVFDVKGKLLGTESFAEGDEIIYTRVLQDSNSENPISVKQFDVNHLPFSTEGSPFETRYTNRTNINEKDTVYLTVEENFDKTGAKMFNSNGYHRLETKNEKKSGNNVTTSSYYDTKDQLISMMESGAIYVIENSIEPLKYSTAYSYDVNRNPVVDANGIWKVVYEQRTPTENYATFFDKSNKPAVDYNNVHCIVLTTNILSLNTIQRITSYFDIKGNPIHVKEDGYFKCVEIIENNDIVSESYFDKKGKPCIHAAKKCHQITYGFTPNDDRTFVKMFNTKGKAIDVKSNEWFYGLSAHQQTWTYNKIEQEDGTTIYQLTNSMIYNAKGKEMMLEVKQIEE